MPDADKTMIHPREPETMYTHVPDVPYVGSLVSIYSYTIYLCTVCLYPLYLDGQLT